MEVEEGPKEDKSHRARQDSSEVISGSPSRVRLFSSSKGKKAGSALGTSDPKQCICTPGGTCWAGQRYMKNNQ